MCSASFLPHVKFFNLNKKFSSSNWLQLFFTQVGCVSYMASEQFSKTLTALFYRYGKVHKVTTDE